MWPLASEALFRCLAAVCIQYMLTIYAVLCRFVIDPSRGLEVFSLSREPRAQVTALTALVLELELVQVLVLVPWLHRSLLWTWQQGQDKAGLVSNRAEATTPQAQSWQDDSIAQFGSRSHVCNS